MAKHLELELEKLKQMIYTQSALIDENLELAVKSVQDKDPELGKKVIGNDKQIDQMDVALEEECLKILALHQPVAIDLRFIISALKMNNDLERIGDLAADIAKNGIYLHKCKQPRIPLDLHQMTYLAKSIVRKALDSLINIDSYLAREVLTDDLAIDALKTEMKAEIIAAVKSQPEMAEPLMILLAITHRLERIGDHACNIAEDVIYMIDAEIIRHQHKDA
jgi:phosphate transport system protein